METENENFIEHVSCDACGSSDAKAVYEDGHTYCFRCQKYDRGDGEIMETFTKNGQVSDQVFTQKMFGAIDDRKITKETCVKYGVTQETDKHFYPYYNDSGEQVATKTRIVSKKNFTVTGSLRKCMLFGSQAFVAGSAKTITLTEGELDAMSVYEMNGKKYPAVSVGNASSAYNHVHSNYEYLNSFNSIYIALDNDKAGQQHVDKIAGLFEPNKCKIVNMTMKDPSEYLVAHKRELFIKEWWAAETYTPAGIINMDKLGDSLYDEKDYESIPYPWSGLTKKTYGMRTGELITLTSGTGLGKSSMTREIAVHLLDNSEHNIGLLALEESVKQTAFHLMSVKANRRLHIKEEREKFSRSELKKWEDVTIGTGRFFAFDHFGSIENDEILSRIRYMIKVLDCRWIILDHLSILISGQDSPDERKGIDILMTKLRSLVEETGAGLILVSHLKRVGDKGHEEGLEVSLSHLRGSQAIAQLSDIVIGAERNQQEEDPILKNTTTLRVLKNRYSGDCGVAAYLLYNSETGRLSEIDNPFVETETAANSFKVLDSDDGPVFT
jgi:twinkle protein